MKTFFSRAVRGLGSGRKRAGLVVIVQAALVITMAFGLLAGPLLDAAVEETARRATLELSKLG